jgi:hypothetical protein
MSASSSAFANWLNDFFTSYYKHRPVKATFIGIHEHDHRLPDFSDNGVADVCNDMERLFVRLRVTIKRDELSVAERIDYDMASNYLTMQLAEFRSPHFQQGNPSLYTSEAIFGILALFWRDFAPITQRLEAALARLSDVPRLLAQGRANVRAAPPAWTQKAIRDCLGALNFCSHGINRLIQQHQLGATKLREVADRTILAFTNHQRYLSEELLKQPLDNVGCGAAFFDLVLAKGHALDKNGEHVAADGWAHFNQLKEQLMREARKHRRDGDWQKVLASASDMRPTLENYVASFQKRWSEGRRVAIERKLVTWPDYPLNYILTPEPFRGAAPYLGFLSYHAPPVFDTLPSYDYWVPPIDALLSHDDQMERLRAMSYASIKIDHAIQHGGLGHYAQNFHAARAPSRLGQIAGIDCATRLALFSGTILSKGWASYATDLMGELNFYSSLEAFVHLHMQVRRAARAVVDAKLHLGRFTLTDAVAFYTSHVGLTQEEAQVESVRNSMFPGVACAYLMGAEAIHQLRKDVAAREGAAFSLQKFHDRLLSYGSVPIALVARELLS